MDGRPVFGYHLSDGFINFSLARYDDGGIDEILDVFEINVFSFIGGLLLFFALQFFLDLGRVFQFYGTDGGRDGR